MKPAHLTQLNTAKELIEVKDYPPAAKLINEVLDDDPNCAQALYMLGFIAYEEGRLGMARALLRRCLDLGTNNAKVWCLYGRTFQEGHDQEEGEAAFRRAMAIEPNYVDPYVNLGLSYVVQGKPRMAIPLLQRALSIKPDLPEAKYNLSLCYLLLRDWKKGWPDFDAVLGRVKDRKERVYRSPMEPRWEGKPDQNVVAYGEQGIGDEISFASCLPDLIKTSRKVVVECDSRLERLFARSFPNATVYGTRFRNDIEWNEREAIDARVAFGSLPKFFRTDAKDFHGTPYLIPDPDRVVQWEALLSRIDKGQKRPRIGIAWTGGSKETGSERRKLTLNQLLPILQQDACFVSLEYKDREAELASFSAKYGIKVHSWDRATRTGDYDDTAALVSCLDLVVGVTTASLHLSGALGVKTFAMVPEWPTWMWGVEGSTFPWSSCTTLYRQRGSWDSLIKRVAHDVKNLCGNGQATAGRLLRASKLDLPTGIEAGVDHADCLPTSRASG